MYDCSHSVQLVCGGPARGYILIKGLTLMFRLSFTPVEGMTYCGRSQYLYLVRILKNLKMHDETSEQCILFNSAHWLFSKKTWL